MAMGTRLNRRDALKGLGGIVASAAVVDLAGCAVRGTQAEASIIDEPPVTTERTHASDFFTHPLLQAAPQWTLLEDGTLALWMLGRSEERSLRLVPADTASGDLLSAAGVPLDAHRPASGGLFLLTSNIQGQHADLVERARVAGRLSKSGQPLVSFYVEAQGQSGEANADQGPAVTLALPAANVASEEFSFLLGSCIHPDVQDRVQTLRAMARVKADFCFLLGDTTYYRPQDWTTRAGMLARFEQNRSLEAFGALGASKPLLSVWDDHDFGPNDANGSFPYKGIAREVFLSHFPRDVRGAASKNEGESEGIEFTIKVGTTRIVFLDDRTWRDPTPWVSSNGGDYLGRSQFAWLEGIARKRDYERLIVAGGSQFYAPNPFKESYRRHGREFRLFTEMLQDTLEVPVAFLSGDIHMTEVTALEKIFPRGAVEITSSGVGNLPNGIIRTFKRLNRSAYLYDEGLSFVRISVRREALWAEHFNSAGRMLARMRFA